MIRFVLAASLILTGIARAQQPVGAVALGDLVQGLGVTTRVMVIGAHPDDEDTYLISWLARGRHVETAYLSLTRGEGGQNLIGSELGYALGQIRTEELLAARRVDGAHQYFTRAVDFGFSKSYAETDSLWPRDLILRDMVTAIRAFRPHVIVSVWSGTEADGHGHHQYAGVIAKRAFDEAAVNTSVRSPVSGMPPWTPLKFYRTARVAGGGSLTAIPGESPGNVLINVGEYNPLFGRSYAEIGALSRSQHLSQGMGMMLPLGTIWDGLKLDTSRVTLPADGDRSLFDGIDTTWGRFATARASAGARAALDSLPAAVVAAQAAFNAPTAAPMVPLLSRVLVLARTARAGLSCSQWLVPQCPGVPGDLAAALNTTIDRASRALILAAGVTVDGTSTREQVAVKDSVDVTVALYNRGKSRVELVRGSVTVEDETTDLGVRDVLVASDSALRLGGRVRMSQVSYPWWLIHGAAKNGPYYDFQDVPGGMVEQTVMGEDRIQSSQVDLDLRIDGVEVRATTAPIVYKFADPVRGEQRYPLVSVPKITTLFQSSVEFIRAKTPIDRPVRVFVRSSWSMPDTVLVTLGLPPGFRADSASRRIVLPPFGSATVFFRVKANVEQAVAPYIVTARVTDRAGVYQQGFIEILYNHIRPVRYYQPPELYLAAVDVKIPAGLDVAYVRGVGDNVPRMLEQLDIKIKTIPPEAIASLDLTAYNSLVIGPRAYEAIETVRASAAAIQNFARRGGTVVVQHTQDADKPGILPYPVTLANPADRITDEKAKIVFLDSSARVLRWPNRITPMDFGLWFQERALLMPHTFDPRYKALFSMQDKGESPNSGGLLVTPLGKGMFVYTTLSFSRQIPNGNAGALRLFVNLLSAGMKAPP